MIKIVCILLVLLIYFIKPIEGFTGFDYLMSEFRNIFKDGNRNAGGVQFYKHIHGTNK